MEWISVEDKDRLPKLYDFVIVSADDVIMACWDGTAFVLIADDVTYEIADVTHWMPLPEPPKNQGDE